MKEVFERKNEEFKILFRKIVSHLKRFDKNQFISNSKIHGLIDKFNQIGKLKLNDMHYAFETTWKDIGFGENQEIQEIIMELNKFINEFYSRYNDRKESIEELIIEIPNHSFKDKDILELIKQKCLREFLHEKDEDILFDLNQFAKEHPELDLCFVSWDDKFIKAVKILLNQLSFKRYMGLHESNLK